MAGKEGAAMFEAIVTICLDVELEQCRDKLVPGYEAESLSVCMERLAAKPIDGAICQPSGEPLEVEEVAPGVFVHVGKVEEPDRINLGDVANVGFIEGEAAVAVIDAGSTAAIGESLWRSISSHTDKPVRYIVLTHMHPDHVFGMSVFVEAGAEVVGHARLNRALADRRANYRESLARLVGDEAFLGSDIDRVDLPVEESLTIDLGQRELLLHAWPTAHTGTDLTVTDMTTGIMFAGDLVFDDHTPALDGSLRGWQAALEAMRAMNVVAVVPGHGEAPLAWPEAGLDTERYLNVLARDTRKAIDAGERLGEAVRHVAESERAHWRLFDEFNPRNATVAYTELEWE